MHGFHRGLLAVPKTVLFFWLRSGLHFSAPLQSGEEVTEGSRCACQPLPLSALGLLDARASVILEARH